MLIGDSKDAKIRSVCTKELEKKLREILVAKNGDGTITLSLGKNNTMILPDYDECYNISLEPQQNSHDVTLSISGTDIRDLENCKVKKSKISFSDYGVEFSNEQSSELINYIKNQDKSDNSDKIALIRDYTIATTGFIAGHLEAFAENKYLSQADDWLNKGIDYSTLYKEYNGNPRLLKFATRARYFGMATTAISSIISIIQIGDGFYNNNYDKVKKATFDLGITGLTYWIGGALGGTPAFVIYLGYNFLMSEPLPPQQTSYHSPLCVPDATYIKPPAMLQPNINIY